MSKPRTVPQSIQEEVKKLDGDAAWLGHDGLGVIHVMPPYVNVDIISARLDDFIRSSLPDREMSLQESQRYRQLQAEACDILQKLIDESGIQ